MNFVTQVSALVIKDDRVLMKKEIPDKTTEQWNLPGGEIRFRERVVDAVIREVFEETGKVFTPESIIGIYTRCSNDHYYHFVVKGEINDSADADKPAEDPGAGWISLSEMTSYNLINPSEIERIIDDYLSGVHLPLTIIKEDLDI